MVTEQRQSLPFWRKLKYSGFDYVNYFLVLVFLIIILYPLWYVLMASFSDIYALIDTPVLLSPVDFTLDAYKKVFETNEIWMGLKNSLLYTACGTALNVFMTLITAYPLSRDTIPGKKWMMVLITMTMYINGGMIPNYLVVDTLGMRNTIFALILPGAVSAYLLIVSISFIKSTVPESIIEAARIDGCTHFQTFCRIIVPLSVPLIGVLSLQYGLNHWNSYTSALIYLDERNMYPLQLVLREILIRTEVSSMMNDIMTMSYEIDYEQQVALREGIKYVSMVVTSVPLLIIYPFLNKFFAKGLVLGGVKE